MADPLAKIKAIPQALVTGLVSALAGKASSVHSHAISDVTGLQAAIDAKQNTIADGTLAPEKLSAPVAVFLKSANAHYWRIVISDLGVISGTDVGTDVPSGETED